MEHMQNIKPKAIKLGEVVTMRKKGLKRQFMAQDECFMYISIIDNIHFFLQNNRIREMVLSNPRMTPEGFFFDLYDGQIVNENQSLTHGDLSLLLYYDEIDICNPLGSKAGVHKMSMFYYSFANVDIKFRSKLEAIRLLAVAESRLVKKYGVDKILEPFISDMIALSNGVDMMFDKEIKTIKAHLIAVLGDTPACHSLGGFKEGVGFAFSKCRECMCTSQNMTQAFDSLSFTPRCLTTHLQQCNEIDLADTEYMKSHLCTTFGINRRSSLLKVPNFDVCTMMPQDVMHVLLEGVAQYEIKEVIKQLIRDKVFSLSQFNALVISFRYPYFDIRNKPSVLLPTTMASDDNRLRQTASQMLVLIKILPFVLTSVVQKDNMYFQFMSELITIANILLSPLISIGSVLALKNLLQEHFKRFTQLFPQCSVIPKQHYICHFPETILRYGPPIRYSCMRFEAKHKQFKSLARKINFKNVTKSLAEDYQKSESIFNGIENDEDHPLFSSERIIGHTKISDNLQQESELVSSFFPEIGCIQSIYFCSSVVLYGTKYVANQCVLALSCTEFLPIFGILKKIGIVSTSNDQNMIFYFETFETKFFDDDMKAYVVEKPNVAQGYDLKKPDQCIDFACYSLVTHKDETYIPIRYDLTSLIEINNSGEWQL